MLLGRLWLLLAHEPEALPEEPGGMRTRRAGLTRRQDHCHRTLTNQAIPGAGAPHQRVDRTHSRKEIDKMPPETAAGGTSIVDVLDRILDKGLVIDAFARVSVIGLEVLTVEARVV